MKNQYNSCFPVIFLLLMATFPAYSQENQEMRVSGNFAGITFDEFAREIEAKTDYHFYFDSLQVDTLTVRLQADNALLPELLRELFLNTDFHYAIDKQKHVFITYGWIIQTELIPSFFNRKKNEEENTDIIVDYFEDNPATKADEDNKVFAIGIKTNTIRPGMAQVTGRILDEENGEPLTGATLQIENPFTGVSTDPLGYYSMTIPRGRHKLIINSLGMRSTERNVIVYSDGQFDIELKASVQSLKEVIVEAERDLNITGTQMGMQKMDIKTIKQIPTALGESDVLRVVLTLPGVKSVGEASTGFNVRGGATDQNLILFNGVPIYNPSHLFGFFSAFNPDILKDVELHKSTIPARFGGRLASVLDISTREGNKKKFAGSGGIGPVTGRLTLEGPIIHDKTSIIVGGRANYSNWLLKKLSDPDYRKSKASFYDLNLGISHQFNEKNNLHLTAYSSSDRFRFKADTTYRYQNQNVSFKWKSLFNEKLYGTFSGGYSRYNYHVGSTENPVNAYKLAFDIEQTQAKADFNYFPLDKHSFDFGVSVRHYKLHPGSFLPNSDASLVTPDVLESERALESAVYIADVFTISPNLTLDAGFRYAVFNYLGPKNINTYVVGQPKAEYTITDTVAYKKNEVINTYKGPEYRLALRLALSSQEAIKMSYNSHRQYIHMLSNTTAVSPTDIWKLSDPNIRPQFGEQFSLGFYKNFRAGVIETSIEAYYKKISNYLDYKSGANLIMNHHIETDVVNTDGRAYGVELMVKKTIGKLNGWMSYTYSRSLLQQNDDLAEETINQGDWYPSNFDKPHDFTFIGNYKFSHRFSLSLNFTYSTGRPITVPIAQYQYGGSDRVYYSDRNAYRIPDYYRADVAMNIEGNHKIRKLAHSSWTLAIYNLTGRKNPYSVYFLSENGGIQGYKLSIFGQAIPTITYNFRF
ncbi:MAG: TonB-dependent receptor [Cyclobacteriaceae bacterium]